MYIVKEIQEAAQDAAWGTMLKLLGEKDWFVPVNWVKLTDYDNIEHLLSDIEQPYTSVELIAEIDNNYHTTVEEIISLSVAIENNTCDKVLFVRANGDVYNFYAIEL
jgi:hypothetical protein